MWLARFSTMGRWHVRSCVRVEEDVSVLQVLWIWAVREMLFDGILSDMIWSARSDGCLIDRGGVLVRHEVLLCDVSGFSINGWKVTVLFRTVVCTEKAFIVSMLELC